MNTYTVYFEIFGKKMKCKVQAKSEEEAKYQVYGKLIFYKIEKTSDEQVKFFKQMFGFDL
jgi:hypothetical protein